MDWKPGCPEWINENGSPKAEQKRQGVLEKLVREDYKKLPTADLVKSWHTKMFEGIAPSSDYVGQFRDKEQTSLCLQDYEVSVGGIRGTGCDQVLKEVDGYFRKFMDLLDAIEKSLPFGSNRKPEYEEVSLIVKLAAWAHGEWVRIHPFANGNGRTSRLLANYVLVRFGFGPALVLRPRPNPPYGKAGRLSMEKGDHSLMETIIWQLLAESYQKK